MIRLIGVNGNPEYIRQEDIRRIFYHPSFEKVVVSLTGGDTYSPPAELSVDEVYVSLFPDKVQS